MVATDPTEEAVVDQLVDEYREREIAARKLPCRRVWLIEGPTDIKTLVAQVDYSLEQLAHGKTEVLNVTWVTTDPDNLMAIIEYTGITLIPDISQTPW